MVSGQVTVGPDESSERSAWRHTSVHMAVV